MSRPPDAVEFAPPRASALGRDLAAAGVVALAAISFYVSAATLLFQGELAAHLPVAIGAALLGGAVLAAVAAWRGALPLASVGPEPATVPVLAAITGGIGASVSGPALLPTALAALTLTGAAIGALWWLAGRRGWGELMRYIPYPVIGGFLGSIGYLMLTGGLGVSTGQGFSGERLLAWVSGQADLRLLAGALLGVAIWRVTLRFTHPLTLPSVMVAGALLLHAALAAAGLGLDEARAAGWLLAAFDRTTPLPPWSPELIAAVRWDAVLQQLPLIASAVIVASIGLLLSDTSLEVAWDQNVDINRDLRTLGQGNLLTVAVGGLVGGMSISRSVLNKAAGAATRASGAAKGALCLLAMAGGGPLIALVPRPLLGGMLVYLGIGMLKAWLVDSRHRLPLREYLIVVVMVAVTAVVGFLAAVSVGVLACCVDFAAASARLSPLRRLIRRSHWPAKAEHGAAEEALLQAEGRRLCILELQGVLFFGSAAQVARQVEPLWSGPDRPECLLFDFRHVRGLDTSAAQSLARLFKGVRRQGVRVALAGLSEPLRRTLQGAQALAAVDGGEHVDVDAAVAAWDDERLSAAAVATAPSSTSGFVDDAALVAWVPPGQDPAAWWSAHFESLSLAPGEVLFRQGDAPEALYLVRRGRVAIVAGAGPSQVLLRTVHAGSAIGEMGLFRGVPRSAAARAVDAVSLYRLSRQRLDALAREQPQVHAQLCGQLLVQMAGRIERLDMQANALAR